MINSNLINVSVVFDDYDHIQHELISLRVSSPDLYTFNLDPHELPFAGFVPANPLETRTHTR